MIPPREVRDRVLEALERTVKQFRAREELYPLRVPREPLAFDDVIAPALGNDRYRFDPATLRSRTVLHLEWDDGSVWDLWVVVLPSGLKLFCDSGEEESRILASGGRNLGDETDRLFLELLSESAGDHFGIEMSGGAPSRVRSSIDNRAFLVDVFLNLFEGTDAEASIRSRWAAPETAAQGDPGIGRDFREEVEHWLDLALSA
jgi:hypothetical protein